MTSYLRFSILSAAALAFLAVPLPDISAEPTGDPAVQAHLLKGDELAAQGKYGSARDEYKKAVELQRQRGELPAEALRRIAYSYFYQERFQAAGHTLVSLAEEAATYGDIATEVWALADAAWLAGVNGNWQMVEKHVARVEKLLTSPYLPDEIKAKVRQQRLASIESGEFLALTP
ncbi:MAG: hypothetical protein GWN99_20115 [Gemmatimonadetes bacterium]|uniref:Tetratricopeptide repeat protein n=1 Tax=Candidatus Kutchimonas denitrificans TaxID=3056748 RepID=A0AAE4ZDJ4_9BACT|nr:hypothetical protein [Gemmatimonadota bacterium]NIR76510.1 hypothetical protein [Candidatus Kutchimonas denitrificans]NIS03328.1 hypothetical protein [Gemmatimonadota bacterium]NIT69189.1 hypothetical protein [Gemmatimonadota bacterium]NIU54581.1 hypothetical protein [Gemmatimonadota bacterium]